MNFDEYHSYLKSSWWIARKAAIIRYRGAWCERCGSTDRLELHHRTYERLGYELPEDVELLCWNCHRREHQLPLIPASRPSYFDQLPIREVLVALVKRYEFARHPTQTRCTPPEPENDGQT